MDGWKDGWIDGRKEGRKGVFFVSGWGLGGSCVVLCCFKCREKSKPFM